MTVYLPPAHESVLQDLPDCTGSMKSAACEVKKDFFKKSFFTYSPIALLLDFYTLPKGTKHFYVYVRHTS